MMTAKLNRKARRRSKQPSVRLSYAATMHYLKSEVAVRNMAARERRSLLAELKAMQKRLLGECCTVVWFDDIWEYPVKHSDWISCPGYVPEYPPPAENTPMRKCRCPACRKAGKFWPSQYVGASGWALECWIERHKRLWSMPGTVGNVVRRSDL